MKESNLTKSILLYFLISSSLSVAQGTQLFFQEYLAENLYLIHPAMAGVNLNGSRFHFGSRTQWMTLENAPKTQYASFEYQANAKNTLGLKFFNDHNGYHRQSAVYGTYVFRIFLNDEVWNTRRVYPTKNDEIEEVSFGLSIGNLSRQLDQSGWLISNNDPLVNFNQTQHAFTSLHAGIAYVSTHLSAQFSIHNLAINPVKNSTLSENEVINRLGYKHFVASLQYEVFTNSGWNFEPAFLFQYLEKTQDSAWEASFKIYRLFRKGRIWMGTAFRKNNTGVVVQNINYSLTQYDKNWTPLMGLNFNRLQFSYQYNIPIGSIRMGSGGIHFINLGFQP